MYYGTQVRFDLCNIMDPVLETPQLPLDLAMSSDGSMTLPDTTPEGTVFNMQVPQVLTDMTNITSTMAQSKNLIQNRFTNASFNNCTLNFSKCC